MKAVMKILCRIVFMFAGTHKTEVLAIACCDFRFFKGLQKLYRTLGISFPDEVKIPGGPMLVAKRNDMVMGWIRLLYELHGIKEVLLVSHATCGAYKSEGIWFMDDKEEQEFHEKELRLAKEAIAEMLPGLRMVRMVFARFSSDGKKLIEYVEID